MLVGTAGDDVIVGWAGNDVIDGKGGNDIIVGGAGNDTINGGNGDDLICGSKGDDIINGQAGNDQISGEAGDDQINGGIGDDVLFGGLDIDTIDGNAGEDTISGGVGDDVLDGQADNDTVFGDGGADVIHGSNGDDELWGSWGPDEIRGGEGDDFIGGGPGWDRLFGWNGADEIQGGDGNDWLWGGPGDDLLRGLGGDNDRVNGQDGTDVCDGETPGGGCETGGVNEPTVLAPLKCNINGATDEFTWTTVSDAFSYVVESSADGETWDLFAVAERDFASTLRRLVTDAFDPSLQYRVLAGDRPYSAIDRPAVVALASCLESPTDIADPGVATLGCAASVRFSATLRWSFDASADAYEVDRSLDGGSTWEFTDGFTATLSGKGEVVAYEPGEENSYRVRSLSGGVELHRMTCQTWSPNPEPPEPGPAPEAPERIIVTSGDGMLNLSWWPVYYADSYNVLLDGQLVATTADFAIDVPDVAGVYSVESADDGVTSPPSELVNYSGVAVGTCIAVGLNDGTTVVTWENAPDGHLTVLDNANGVFEPLAPLADPIEGHHYFVDSVTAQAGSNSPDYRVVAELENGSLVSQECSGRAFEPSEFDRLAGIDFPVTDDGFIGGSSSPSTAAPVNLFDEGPFVPPPGSVTEQSPSFCSTGALSIMARETGIFSTAEITVPAGVQVRGDIFDAGEQIKSRGSQVNYLFSVQKKTDDGQWVAAPTRLKNGSSVDGARTSQDVHVFDAASAGTYRMQIYVDFMWFMYWGSWSLTNLRFTNGDGDFIAEPCAPQELAKCLTMGGGMYVAPGATAQRDGQTFGPGCYAIETCATSSWPAVADMVAKWACKNDDTLNAAQDIATSVAVVAGMIYIAPAALTSTILFGTGLGVATAFWTCDQSDNGALTPGGLSDLDASCVATEAALGAVFAPVGAAGAAANLGRRAAVACAWGAAEGATGVAAFAYVDEDRAFEAADALVGSAVGCVTAGVLDSAFARFSRQADDIRLPARCNSFPTGTLVLMADGTRVAIEDIEPGQSVVGYDTDAGVFGSHEVLDQWSHLDDGDIVTIGFDDGLRVSATDHHLFWLADDQVWAEADDLVEGDRLLDVDGSPVSVTGITIDRPIGGELVWELSVADVNTFTVSTGAADVVVHNASTECDPEDVLAWRDSSTPDRSAYPFNENTVGSAERLRENLIAIKRFPRKIRFGADGIQRNTDQAHHMVAKVDARTEPARDALKEMKIDIDDPRTGIFLERPGLATADPSGRAIHGGVFGPVHRTQHLNYINQRITQAVPGGRDAGLQVLDEIYEELDAGIVRGTIEEVDEFGDVVFRQVKWNMETQAWDNI